jgi:hypothetical protein
LQHWSLQINLHVEVDVGAVVGTAGLERTDGETPSKEAALETATSLKFYTNTIKARPFLKNIFQTA